MQCPDCHSTHIRKNGKNKGKKITSVLYAFGGAKPYATANLSGQTRVSQNVCQWHGI